MSQATGNLVGRERELAELRHGLEGAFAGFSSDTVMMILGLLMLTAALGRTGVVDWIGCCIGPPGVDLGHCRQNLATALSLDAADAIEAPHPWFDLASAVDAIENGPQFGSVERFEDFLERALAELG